MAAARFRAPVTGLERNALEQLRHVEAALDALRTIPPDASFLEIDLPTDARVLEADGLFDATGIAARPLGATRTVRGLKPPPAGFVDVVWVVNDSLTENLEFEHASTSTTFEARFILPLGSTLVLTPGGSAALRYRHEVGAWYVVSQSFSTADLGALAPIAPGITGPTLLGKVTGTGDVESLTPAEAASVISLAGVFGELGEANAWTEPNEFSGGVTISGGGLTVTADGISVTAGGLSVTGASAFANAVTFNGSADFNSAANFDGQVDINADLDVNSTSAFAGLATFGGGVLIALGGLDVALGGITVDGGGLDVNSGGITVDAGGIGVTAGGIDVTGSSIFRSAVEFDAAVNFDAQVDINADLDVNSTSSFAGVATFTGSSVVIGGSTSLTANGNVSVFGSVFQTDAATSAVLGGSLQVTGAITAFGPVTLTGTSVTVDAGTPVTFGDEATFNDDVGFNGNNVVSSVSTTMQSNGILAVASSGLLSCSGQAVFNNDAQFNSHVEFTDKVREQDDFGSLSGDITPSTTGATAYCALPWAHATNADTGSISLIPSESGHPGIVRLATAASGSRVSAMGRLDENNINNGVFSKFSDIRSMTFVARLSRLTSLGFRIGCMDDMLTGTANIVGGSWTGAMFSSDTTTYGSSNLFAFTADGSSANITDLGSMASLGLTAFNKFEIRQTTVGTVQFLINGTVVATHSTGTVPGSGDASVNPMVYGLTRSSVALSVDVDLYRLESRILSR